MTNAQFVEGDDSPPIEPKDNSTELLRRFVDHKDQSAFTALVELHGPLVFDVCRRVLRDRHAAEDAFQAVFHVLAKKGATIQRPHLLGNWLYGVAYRVSQKAKTTSARRKNYESQAATMTGGESKNPIGEPNLQVAWQEMRSVLDEELNRLPQKLRDPIILSYLEGRTHVEVAEALNIPLGSVSGRLAKARDTLRQRLARRGVAFSLGALGLAMAKEAHAAVPATLIQHTVRSVTGPSSWVSPSVAALTKSFFAEALAAKIKAALIGIALLLMLVIGVVVGTIKLALMASEAKNREPIVAIPVSKPIKIIVEEVADPLMENVRIHKCPPSRLEE